MPLRWAEHASLADIRSRGDDGDLTLDRIQLYQYSMTTISVFWYFEDQFHQHRDGLVDHNRFSGSIKTLEMDFRQPGFRVSWKRFRYLFGSEYRTFMDAIMHQTRAATPSEPVAAWKADIEAELLEAGA
jgi:hypothetical protein